MALIEKAGLKVFEDAWKTDNYSGNYEKVTDMLPISILKQFREYNRNVKKLRRPLEIEELSKDLINNGIEDQLVITYNPYNGYANIGEGNHRLMIAIMLGVTHLPVRISRNRYLEPDASGKSGGGYIKNPKILSHKYRKHINADLKPSDVFDINDFYEENQFKKHIMVTHHALVNQDKMEMANKLLKFYISKGNISFESSDLTNEFKKLLNDMHWIYFEQVGCDYEGTNEVYYLR